MKYIKGNVFVSLWSGAEQFVVISQAVCLILILVSSWCEWLHKDCVILCCA